MGRLTLNVLLSFAQFEREVTGERIRDKIAASKKKGMWMGGVVPLGYEARDRSLVINPTEAEAVRTLFDLYLRFRNTRLVKEEADRLGMRTKQRPSESNPKRKGGGSFQRGHINKVLTNPLYIGEILHKGIRHSAAHKPIIDRATWDAVQAQLKQNAVIRRNGGSARQQSLLAGLLFDDAGVRLSPSHANKKAKRYRYYTSRGARPKWRLPAEPLEKAVLEGVQTLLSDRHRLSSALQGQGFSGRAFVDHLETAKALAKALQDRCDFKAAGDAARADRQDHHHRRADQHRVESGCGPIADRDPGRGRPGAAPATNLPSTFPSPFGAAGSRQG